MRFCNFLFHLCLRKICSLQEKKTWINCCRKLTLLSAPLISHHFSSRKIITYIFQIYLWKMLFIAKNWKDPKHRKFYYIVRPWKIFLEKQELGFYVILPLWRGCVLRVLEAFLITASVLEEWSVWLYTSAHFDGLWSFYCKHGQIW